MHMKPEDLAGYICGINPDYEVLVIGIFIRANATRLLGPEGSHLVHSSNNFGMPGYKKEAAIVWGLTEMINIARDEINSAAGVDKIAQLKIRAAELKAASRRD